MKKNQKEFESLGKSLTRKEMKIVNGGMSDVSYCHLWDCNKDHCDAHGGVPCKCELQTATYSGLCVRIY